MVPRPNTRGILEIMVCGICTYYVPCTICLLGPYEATARPGKNRRGGSRAVAPPELCSRSYKPLEPREGILYYRDSFKGLGRYEAGPELLL